MLLTSRENGAGGKGDTPPDVWMREQLKANPDYLELHCIPHDRKLWKIENVDLFFEKRYEILKEKFSDILLADY